MYKRGFIIFGVVSLTMGNSVLPLGHCLTAYADSLSHKLLRHLAAGAILLEHLGKRLAHDLDFFCKFRRLFQIAGNALEQIECSHDGHRQQQPHEHRRDAHRLKRSEK